MYSDKDTCCFCIPLYVAVIIISCTVIAEFVGALSEKNAWMLFVTIAQIILFIITAIFRNNICVRRILAFGYATVFLLEIVINSLLIMAFFKEKYPFAYCKAMANQGQLEYGTTLNECALYVG